MDAQSAIISSRILHIREMREEISRLKTENATLRAENATLCAHFDLALLAAADLAALPQGGRFIIVDGWNLILGDGRVLAEGLIGREARSPAELIAAYRRYLDDHPADFAWIVFDGKRENAIADGRLRVSYTGGEGSQRADRLIIDFVRMAHLRGHADRISVVTQDKRLKKDAKRLGCLQ